LLLLLFVAAFNLSTGKTDDEETSKNARRRVR